MKSRAPSFLDHRGGGAIGEKPTASIAVQSLGEVVVVVATENSASLGRRLRRRLSGRGIQEGEGRKRGEEACSLSWITPEVSDLEGRMIGIAFK